MGNVSRKYISWVPNVLGKLSFASFIENDSTFGNGRQFEINEQIFYCANGQYVSSDALFPKIQRNLTSENGIFNATFLAYTNSKPGEIGNISGKLYFCSVKLARLSQLNASEIQKFSEVSKKLLLENFSEKSELTKIESVLSETAIFECSFDLSRNGIIQLDLSQQQNWKILPSDAEEETSIAIVCYNTLRDFFHSHKHHHPRADNIVSVHKFVKGDSWKLLVQFSMIRKMIDLHGDHHEEAQIEASGIAAYLETYNKTIVDPDADRAKSRDGSLLIPYSENFSSSIYARERKLGYKRERNIQLIFIFFAMFGVYIALAQILYAENQDFWVPYAAAVMLSFYAAYLIFRLRRDWVVFFQLVKHQSVLWFAKLTSLIIFGLLLYQSIHLFLNLI